MAGSQDQGKPSKLAQLSTPERDGWELDSAVALHEQYPDTFWIPTVEARSSIDPGDFVKLGFQMVQRDAEDGESVLGERMWVKVQGTSGPYFWGTLANDPSFDGGSIGLMFGTSVVFLAEHILAIMSSAEQQERESHTLAPKRLN